MAPFALDVPFCASSLQNSEGNTPTHRRLAQFAEKKKPSSASACATGLCFLALQKILFLYDSCWECSRYESTNLSGGGLQLHGCSFISNSNHSSHAFSRPSPCTVRRSLKDIRGTYMHKPIILIQWVCTLPPTQRKKRSRHQAGKQANIFGNP